MFLFSLLLSKPQLLMTQERKREKIKSLISVKCNSRCLDDQFTPGPSPLLGVHQREPLTTAPPLATCPHCSTFPPLFALALLSLGCGAHGCTLGLLWFATFGFLDESFWSLCSPILGVGLSQRSPAWSWPRENHHLGWALPTFLWAEVKVRIWWGSIFYRCDIL